MKKRLYFPKGDTMKEKLEAELAQRKQEMASLQAEMQELHARIERGNGLLLLKQGAIQQLEMLLESLGAGNGGESLKNEVDAEAADPADADGG